MLAGQAHEIEARYRQAAPASQARDAEHHRTVMEAQARRGSEREGGRQPWPHPRLRLRARLAASRQLLGRVASMAR